MRNLLAVVAGAAVAVAVIFGIEALGQRVYPPPEGLDFEDSEALAAHVAELPKGAFAFVLAAWGLGALAGAGVAGRLGRGGGGRPALIVGLLVLIGTLATLAMIPHPTWVAGTA